MNKITLDIFKYIKNNGFTNQREIAKQIHCSLGFVNKALKQLKAENLLDDNFLITSKGNQWIQSHSPTKAIILAAGPGMRMVPLNTEVPKALMQVKGEILIERLIHQLHEKDIYDIYVIVGFMKEQFEYLIDDFNVHLITNNHYTSRNNLYSLSLVLDEIHNTYIIPCDIYCKKNPFDSVELYSWYMLGDTLVNDYSVNVNTKYEIKNCDEDELGYSMIGISYICKDVEDILKSNLQKMVKSIYHYLSFWENALFVKNKMIVFANIVSSEEYIEINTFDDLRDLDADSNTLNNDAIQIIEDVLQVSKMDIMDVNMLKKGMTNRSFIFTCKNQRYIMRIPGEGTDKLINRKQEYDVYRVLSGKHIADDVIYMNADNGYKITKFIEGARNCDCENVDDLKFCMKKLKQFHELHLKIDFEFNIFEHIEYYESLWINKKSIYRDYDSVKENIFSLKKYIDLLDNDYCLTHIDAVPDNFLFYMDGAEEKVRLIDWEYASMQDPHVDIAMFCIYSLYNRQQVDQLIDIYFENSCSHQNRIKIYAYIACCGLLWSNWCEYKRDLGVEFGEYSLRQYRYAKDYFKIVKNELGDGLCIK